MKVIVTGMLRGASSVVRNFNKITIAKYRNYVYAYDNVSVLMFITKGIGLRGAEIKAT